MSRTTDPKLLEWWIKQGLAHENAVGGRASASNRKRWAEEAAAQGEVLPPHIANLQHVLADSESPLRDEVRDAVSLEIQRRLALHKEKTNA